MRRSAVKHFFPGLSALPEQPSGVGGRLAASFFCSGQSPRPATNPNTPAGRVDRGLPENVPGDGITSKDTHPPRPRQEYSNNASRSAAKQKAEKWKISY
jgi:hypothetical protein